MTSIEEHKQSIRDMLKDIDEKVRNDLIVERQKLIGFAASETACDLFAVLLHKKNLISPGFNMNPRFFVSEKSFKEHFEFDFPRKKEIIPLLIKQEEFKTLLCYGKSKERLIVELAIKNLMKFKNIIEKELGEEI
ncbi:MAG: hypothetical protein V1870_04685 [Candidatus Aenigmatarchaeota archaeon]